MESELHHEKGSKALYVQIRDIYREKILSGQLASGDRIESETEIQKGFGVSRITARQAIQELEKEGMVCRSRGRGTFVTWNGARLPGMDSLNASVKFYGTARGTCFYEAEVRTVRAELCRVFGIPASQTMYCFKRLQKTSTQNLYYAESYYPLDLSLPDLQTMSHEELLNLAEEKARIQTCRVVEEIGVQIPGNRIRRILNITGDVPVLLRKRILKNEQDRELEFTICYYRGDMCRLQQSY